MTLNFRPNVHINSHFKLMSVLSGYKYHVIHRAFWHIKKTLLRGWHSLRGKKIETRIETEQTFTGSME